MKGGFSGDRRIFLALAQDLAMGVLITENVPVGAELGSQITPVDSSRGL